MATRKKKDPETQNDEKPGRFSHDSYWKDLIARFFHPMLKRALPELYADADLDKEPRFLDKEFRDILNTADPEIHSSPHHADYLIEVPLKNQAVAWILLHIEIQGRGSNLAERMHHYKCLIYAHHRMEPAALAIETEKRSSTEMPYYANTTYGTETLYRYNRLALDELDDDELMESDNPFDLVLYAARHALKTNDDRQKYRYLRKSTELLSERGWSQNDKRDLMLFLERITNLTDKQLIAEYIEYQKQLSEEGKIMYVSLMERYGIEQGIEEGKRIGAEEGKRVGIEQGDRKRQLATARKLLARRMPISDIADITELSESEIRGLMN